MLTGKANLERARGLLATASAVLAVEAPNDPPVLLALLDLALKATDLKTNLHWCPIPNDLDGKVERALWEVTKVLKERLAAA